MHLQYKVSFSFLVVITCNKVEETYVIFFRASFHLERDDTNNSVAAKSVYDKYRDYCSAQNITPCSKQKFGKDLRSLFQVKTFNKYHPEKRYTAYEGISWVQDIEKHTLKHEHLGNIAQDNDVTFFSSDTEYMFVSKEIQMTLDKTTFKLLKLKSHDNTIDLQSYPTVVHTKELLVYCLQTATAVRLCEGFRFQNTQNKSPKCDGYIKNKNSTGYCTNCSRHKAILCKEPTLNDTPDENTEPDHKRRRTREPVHYVDEQEELLSASDDDNDDDEDIDPTYGEPCTTTKPKKTMTVGETEEKIDMIFQTFPSLSNIANFRSLLRTQILNSKGAKQRNRWSTE